MSNFAVQVEHLSKEYRIGQVQAASNNLREVLMDSFSAPFRRMNNLLRGEAYGAAGLDETIMALNDISFEIKQGEVVGIIGHNGAGKSTLLKILSRITAPSQGIIRLNGRIGALLEVGTGFHNELTGRENVFLNGAILGMSRTEITRKFDEIVDFAGVERFIDTPVKFYSSGMRLRLGFAVAAHLEPEILIVDEVLAVGDAEFQKKCIGKMSDVAGEGRTVLFVSHNMGAVQNLCSRVIHLKQGKAIDDGDTTSVIQGYLHHNEDESSTFDPVKVNHIGTRKAEFKEVYLRDETGANTNIFAMGSPMIVELVITSTSIRHLETAIVVDDPQGRRLIHAIDRDDAFSAKYEDGYFRIKVIFPELLLYPGEYYLGVYCGTTGEDYDYIMNAIRFQVQAGQVSKRTTPMVSGKATFFMPSQWHTLAKTKDAYTND